MFIYKQGTVERKPLFIRPWGKWWHKEYHILNKCQVYKVYSEFLFYGYQVPTVPPFLIPPFSLWLIKKKHIGKYLYQVTIHSTYQHFIASSLFPRQATGVSWVPWSLKTLKTRSSWRFLGFKAPGWAASSFNWSLNLNLAWSMGFFDVLFSPPEISGVTNGPDLHHPLLVWIKQVIFSDDEQRGSNRRNETHSI